PEARRPPPAAIATAPAAIDAAAAAAWSPDAHVPDPVASLSVREALAVSSNPGAVRVGRRAGERRVAELAARLGLTTPVPPYPSIFLGSAEVVPAELRSEEHTSELQSREKLVCRLL